MLFTVTHKHTVKNLKKRLVQSKLWQKNMLMIKQTHIIALTSETRLSKIVSEPRHHFFQMDLVHLEKGNKKELLDEPKGHTVRFLVHSTSFWNMVLPDYFSSFFFFLSRTIMMADPNGGKKNEKQHLFLFQEIKYRWSIWQIKLRYQNKSQVILKKIIKKILQYLGLKLPLFI